VTTGPLGAAANGVIGGGGVAMAGAGSVTTGAGGGGSHNGAGGVEGYVGTAASAVCAVTHNGARP